MTKNAVIEIDDDLETGTSTGMEDVESTVLKAYELAKQEQEPDVSYEIEGQEETPKVEATKLDTKTTKDDVVIKDKDKEKEFKPSDKTKTAKNAQDDDDIEAPQEWKAEAKEWFKSLPKEFSPAKKEFVRLHNQSREYLRQQTEVIAQEKRRAFEMQDEASDVIQAIRPHLSAWGTKSLTPAQAVTQLASFQSYCIKDPVGAVQSLAESLNVNLGDVASGKVQQTERNISQDPAYLALETKLNQALNYIQTIESSKVQNDEQEIVNQYNALRNEMQNGRYTYPQLHDSSFVQTQFEPLLADIKRNQPSLSWRDAMHRAYIASGGTLSNLSQQSPSRLERENDRLASVKKALSSSAGSQTSFSNGFQMPDKIESDPLKSVMQAYEMLSR